MSDKIVNHFVLADGSTAKYSAEQLAGDVPEVVGIRTGYDGTTYLSAGDAVRTSDTGINEKADNLLVNLTEGKTIGWATGSIYRGAEIPSDNRKRTGFLDKKIVALDCDEGYSYAVSLYDNTNAFVGAYNGVGVPLSQDGQWLTGYLYLGALQKNYKIRIVFRKNDDANLSADDLIHIQTKTYISYVLPDNIVTKKSMCAEYANNTTRGVYEEQTITWGTDNKCINCNTGGISDAGNINVHVSDYIDISNIKYIRLTASPLYSFACMAFYNSEKVFMKAYPNASSNTDYWMEEIEVPDGAVYAVFGNNSAISGKLTVKVEFMTAYATINNRKWTGKKWACVGDSLTEINSRASMRYMDYIQIATGIKPYNMGKSGTGYANRHTQSEAFIDRIANVPTDSDVVTIFGSFNDVFSSSPLDIGTITDTVSDNTLCGFINGTIDALYNALPTAQLGIVTPCPWENANPNDATSRASQYVKALIDICNSRGIACLDLFHCSGMRPWEESYRGIYYTNDDGGGVHPNALGHKIIASHVNAFLDTILI